MSTIDVVIRMVHSITSAVWVGSVLFVAFGLLPSALDGSLNAAPSQAIVSRFRWLSRGCSGLLFVTGGHLAGTLYTVDSLTGSGRGHLVLTGLVEVAAGKLDRGFDEQKVRSPATEAKPFLYAASVVAVFLLVDATLIVYGSGLVY